jgi:nucleotide-binding universal stress UspA family protein
MYKKILVPLDGSNRSKLILPHVEGLAQRYGAKILFFRIVRFPQFDVYNTPNVEAYRAGCQELKDRASSELNTLAGEFKEKGIDAEARISEGPIVREIVDMATAEDVDLIAMSSHGRTGLGRVFYGSVAAGVLHQTDRPILMIRSLGAD